MMKRLLGLSVLILFVGLFTQSRAGVDPKLRVVIDRHTTLEELDRIKVDLGYLGFDFKVDNITFNEAGEIKSITGWLDFGDGNRASFHTDELIHRIIISRKKGSFSVKVNSRF